MNDAALRFATIIEAEKSKGTIDPVLQAQGNFNSGFQQFRAEQVALNSLEPWIEGQASHFSRTGQLIIDQITYGSIKDKINLSYSKENGQSGARDFHMVEFDPNELRQLGSRVVVKAEIEAALPIDLMERATIASTLVNGRRPLISRSTAQERILKWPDPERENDRIWEDIAETDPVVVMDNIASALERKGDAEGAKLWRDRQTQAMVIEMAQRMMVQQQMGALTQGSGEGGPGRGDVLGPDRGANPPPESQPPEMRGEGREQGGQY